MVAKNKLLVSVILRLSVVSIRHPLTRVDEYDPAAGWTQKADMPTARKSLAIGVVNNKIYCIGGQNNSGNPIATNEEYDP